MLLPFKFEPTDLSEQDVTDPDNCFSTKINTLKVAYYDVCGSSYEDFPMEASDAPWFVTALRNDQMFTLQSAKASVPRVEGGVKCRGYLNEQQYNVVFFIDPTQPEVWFGFAAYSYSSNDAKDYLLEITLEMIYIKPEFRGSKLGWVCSYELGRLLSCRVTDHTLNPEMSGAHISVLGQGATPGGRQCLSRFNEGIEFHLYEGVELYKSHFEGEEFVCKEYELPIETEFIDDY
jgi:hypothetical protein